MSHGQVYKVYRSDSRSNAAGEPFHPTQDFEISSVTGDTPVLPSV
jgi:hypothetical protein